MIVKEVRERLESFAKLNYDMVAVTVEDIRIILEEIKRLEEDNISLNEELLGYIEIDAGEDI